MKKEMRVMIMGIIVTMMWQCINGASTACAPSISTGCDSTGKREAETTVSCCLALKDAADSDRECFCLIINKALANTSTTEATYNQLFVVCGIFGTVDSLCPGSTTPSTTPVQTPSTIGSNTPSTTPSTTASTTPSQDEGSKAPLIIGISVGVVVLVVSFIIGTIIFVKAKRSTPIVANYSQSDPNNVNYVKIEPNVANYSQYGTQMQTATVPIPVAPSGGIKDGFVTADSSLEFMLSDLEVATNNFSNDNKIGRGGFGIVYKGVLPNGQQVAVKRLSKGSGQGDKEFQTEVIFLAKLQHRNLVRLLGYCLSDDEALLVYEFVTNKSLDYFVFDSEKRAQLNWPCRFEIIKGIARGMIYLHEDSPLRTMHRDLKAANILLDAEMCPKIADFGLARICDVGQTHINPTHVVGTRGYMAPEYLFHGSYSVKSDIYSLGAIILEIVCGRKITGSSFNQPGSEGLLSYVWQCWEEEKPMEVVDPMLKDSFSKEEVIKCVQLGLLCVQEDSNLRPTMSTIVHILNSYSGGVGFLMPRHPPFIYTGSSHQSTTMSTTTNSTGRMT